MVVVVLTFCETFSEICIWWLSSLQFTPREVLDKLIPWSPSTLCILVVSQRHTNNSNNVNTNTITRWSSFLGCILFLESVSVHLVVTLTSRQQLFKARRDLMMRKKVSKDSRRVWKSVLRLKGQKGNYRVGHSDSKGSRMPRQQKQQKQECSQKEEECTLRDNEEEEEKSREDPLLIIILAGNTESCIILSHDQTIKLINSLMMFSLRNLSPPPTQHVTLEREIKWGEQDYLGSYHQKFVCLPLAQDKLTNPFGSPSWSVSATIFRSLPWACIITLLNSTFSSFILCKTML